MSLRIGIDLGGTKIEVLGMSEDGSIRYRHRIASPRNDYAATLDAITTLVRDCEQHCAQTGRVGIGIPGAISPATGRVKNANSTWLNGRPLREDLAHALHREVRLANDANCFAISEAIDGAGAGADTVFGVILGTGTGGAIVVRQQLLTGPHAIAGEWGHNPLPWPQAAELPGPSCWCGRHGCIETWLSGPGLAADHARCHAENPETVDAATLAALATAGDAHAIASLERYADRLARALATVINLLDPDVIVLGGGLSNLEYLYTRVPQRWQDYVFSDRVDTPLRPPVHGDASGVRGAAWLWEAG